MTKPGAATANRWSQAEEKAALRASAVLTIDLAALRQNYRKLKQAAPGAECAAVVKADAYGIGAVRSVKALAEEGCDTFFVATLDEASEIRDAVPAATLYVLHGVFAGSCPHFPAAKARPVLSSFPEIEEWAQFSAQLTSPLAAALQIDTGMNRQGLTADEIDALANDSALLDCFEISLVMSHLACADRPDHPKNREQRSRFDRLRKLLPAAPASLANSAGIFLGPDFHYDMVRPGISLYGGKAVSGAAEPMETVVQLHGRVVQLRHAREGETVGYGAEHGLTRDSRVAVVAVGYADGYMRSLGASDAATGAAGFIGAHRAPVLGRISMDFITLDVTDVPEQAVYRGAMVELLGEHAKLNDLAGIAGTIDYEILSRLGRRCQRIYLDA